MTFNTNYHDTGLWGVYAVADKDCAMDELAWAIMQVQCMPFLAGALRARPVPDCIVPLNTWHITC